MRWAWCSIRAWIRLASREPRLAARAARQLGEQAFAARGVALQDEDAFARTDHAGHRDLAQAGVERQQRSDLIGIDAGGVVEIARRRLALGAGQGAIEAFADDLDLAAADARQRHLGLVAALGQDQAQVEVLVAAIAERIIERAAVR